MSLWDKDQCTKLALWRLSIWSHPEMWNVTMLTCSLSAANFNNSQLMKLESVLVSKSLKLTMFSRGSLSTTNTTTKLIFSWWNGRRWMRMEQHREPWSSAWRAYQTLKLLIASKVSHRRKRCIADIKTTQLETKCLLSTLLQYSCNKGVIFHMCLGRYETWILETGLDYKKHCGLWTGFGLCWTANSVQDLLFKEDFTRLPNEYWISLRVETQLLARLAAWSSLCSYSLLA